jgi:addiction module HigA family antidote
LDDASAIHAGRRSGLVAADVVGDIRWVTLRLSDIVNGKRGITGDTALRLARYFGNSPDFWMNLQAAYDSRAAEREASVRIEREVSPREAA